MLAVVYFLSALNEVVLHSFGKLKTYEDWTFFFVWLLRLVHDNKVTTREWEDHIKTTIMPAPGDIVGVCRLLFHSLVGIRLPVADGQHRGQALLTMFTSHYINSSSTRTPARCFEREPHRSPGLFAENPSEAAKAFSSLCEQQLWTPVNVFICFPRTEGNWSKEVFLDSAVKVSRIREKASTKKTPYGNSNV